MSGSDLLGLYERLMVMFNAVPPNMNFMEILQEAAFRECDLHQAIEGLDSSAIAVKWKLLVTTVFKGQASSGVSSAMLPSLPSMLLGVRNRGDSSIGGSPDCQQAGSASDAERLFTLALDVVLGRYGASLPPLEEIPGCGGREGGGAAFFSSDDIGAAVAISASAGEVMCLGVDLGIITLPQPPGGVWSVHEWLQQLPGSFFLRPPSCLGPFFIARLPKTLVLGIVTNAAALVWYRCMGDASVGKVIGWEASLEPVARALGIAALDKRYQHKGFAAMATPFLWDSRCGA